MYHSLDVLMLALSPTCWPRFVFSWKSAACGSTEEETWEDAVIRGLAAGPWLSPPSALTAGFQWVINPGAGVQNGPDWQNRQGTPGSFNKDTKGSKGFSATGE